MGENSNIEWTDHTFNPWLGCTKVSEACRFCYAERDMDLRFGKVAWGPSGTRVLTTPANWQKPITWEKQLAAGKVWRCNQCGRRIVSAGQHPACPADGCGGTGDQVRRERVFCASLADVFEDWRGPISDTKGQAWTKPWAWSPAAPADRSDWTACDLEPLQQDPQGWQLVTMGDLREQLFRLIDKTPHLDWLLLTKRPENIVSWWPFNPGEAYRPNVWLGTSVEDQAAAEQRIPWLLKSRHLAPVLFLSCEPLLEAVQLGDLQPINWVIGGGESGPDARPMHPDWIRSLRNQCQLSAVPFLFKQWGEWLPWSQWTEKHGGRNGKIHEWPDGEKAILTWKKAAGRELDGREWTEYPGEGGMA